MELVDRLSLCLESCKICPIIYRREIDNIRELGWTHLLRMRHQEPGPEGFLLTAYSCTTYLAKDHWREGFNHNRNNHIPKISMYLTL